MNHRLELKHKTIKLLRANIRENLDYLGYANKFLYIKDMIYEISD